MRDRANAPKSLEKQPMAISIIPELEAIPTRYLRPPFLVHAGGFRRMDDSIA
jgi:hypothetical protein